MVTSVLEAAQGPAATLPRSSRRRYGHRLLLIVVLAVVAAGVAGLVSGGRSVAATGPYTAQVSWPAVTGAAAVRIELNRHLIDQVSTDGAGGYDLHGLWPATSFRVDIDVLDARGRVLAH